MLDAQFKDCPVAVKLVICKYICVIFVDVFFIHNGNWFHILIIGLVILHVVYSNCRVHIIFWMLEFKDCPVAMKLPTIHCEIHLR